MLMENDYLDDVSVVCIFRPASFLFQFTLFFLLTHFYSFFQFLFK